MLPRKHSVELPRPLYSIHNSYGSCKFWLLAEILWSFDGRLKLWAGFNRLLVKRIPYSELAVGYCRLFQKFHEPAPQAQPENMDSRVTSFSSPGTVNEKLISFLCLRSKESCKLFTARSTAISTVDVKYRASNRPPSNDASKVYEGPRQYLSRNWSGMSFLIVEAMTLKMVCGFKCRTSPPFASG